MCIRDSFYIILFSRGALTVKFRKLSESQIFSHQKNFDPAGMSAASGDHNLIAEAVRREAVPAFPCSGAGCFFIQPDSVGRAGHSPGPFKGPFQSSGYLIHTGNNYHMPGAVNQTGHTLPFPSILTSSPSYVMALVLIK